MGTRKGRDSNHVEGLEWILIQGRRLDSRWGDLSGRCCLNGIGLERMEWQGRARAHGRKEYRISCLITGGKWTGFACAVPDSPKLILFSQANKLSDRRLEARASRTEKS